MKRIQTVGLLVLGIVLGVFGVTAAEKTGLVPSIGTGASGTVADACTPQSEKDNVFFVSCGGIY